MFSRVTDAKNDHLNYQHRHTNYHIYFNETVTVEIFRENNISQKEKTIKSIKTPTDYLFQVFFFI